MKKNIILLILTAFLGVCSNLSAQNFTVGVKGGFSIPNLTGGSAQNPLNTGYSSRLGSDYGVYGEYHFDSFFSVSFGAEYSSQGGHKNKAQAFTPTGDLTQLGVPYLYADFKSVAKLNYLIFPVLARFNWGIRNLPLWKVYAAVGPFAGFLLNAHQVTSGSSNIYTDPSLSPASQITPQPVSFDANINIKDQLHHFNAGVDGFLGIAYRLSSKNSLFIEGGGNFGFIPIQKVSADGKNRTGAGVVTLGYAHTF